MKAACVRCGEEIMPGYETASMITDDEVREFRKEGFIRGDYLCAPCFHRLKFPYMAPERSTEDLNPLEPSNDW